MSKHRILVDLHGSHAHVDLSGLPVGARPIIVAALAQHLGYDLLDLAKAGGGGEGPDPRFPEIEALLARMRSRWNWWTQWLVERLLGATRGPQTATQAAAVMEILRQHEAGTIAATTGATTDQRRVDEHVAGGRLDPEYPLTAPIPTAFALGAALDPDHPPHVPKDPATHRPAQAVLTDEDLVAARYTRERAAIYMRRPIVTLQQAAQHALLDRDRPRSRVLSEEETQTVRRTVVEGIAEHASVAEVARSLRDATIDTALTNDMDRVSRTELSFAHNHGAYVALVAGLEPGEDPLVYKIVSPGACEQCRRIWGHPTNPVHYKLSVVEAWSNAGGNFRKPAKQWGPTIGPTHPRCTCPPLLRWNPEVHDAVQDVAAELAAIYGRR